MTAKCKKCGGVDIHTRFIRVGECIDQARPPAMPYREWEELRAPRQTECLRRVCRACSYWWLDRTEDQRLADELQSAIGARSQQEATQK
jgi:hypothetical protein